MDDAKGTFGEVVTRFKARLTVEEQKNFEFTTLDDVRTVVLRIQRDQENVKSLMNFTRLQSFFEAMEQFSNIIAVFLNTSNILCFIWGPMKFLLQTASTWTESFDILLDAYKQIGDHLPLLDQHEAIFDYSPRMKEVLAFVYEDILDFHKQAIRFFSGRVWRQVFRSAWKDFDTRFKGILERLQHHKNLVMDQAALLHYHKYKKDSREVQDFIQNYQIDSQETLRHIQQHQQDRREHIERLEQDKYQRNYRAVVEWLSGATSSLDHESFCDTRRVYPGSGEWILAHEKIKNWKDAEIPVSSILWLNGIPGAGKTVIASVIIEDCLNDHSSTTSYFYCRESDSQKNNCLSIFKGLLTQLVGHCHELIQREGYDHGLVPYCYNKTLASGELTLNTLNLAKQLLELFCQKIPRLYFVIDGLDECEIRERKLLLSILQSINESHEPGKLRVLFVSQDYPDIKTELKAASVLPLSALDNAKDIQRFVHQETLNLKPKYDLDKHQIERISNLTCARAQGMFLFAKLVMENLSRQLTKQNLVEEISENRFPRGLEQAYERIMSRMKRDLEDPEWMIAQKLLGWMVCTRRPLKWHEIQGAISIDPEQEIIAFDERKLRTHIRDLCGSLIQALPGDRVEFVHNTAKIHITRSGYVRTSVVECNLAVLCMRYLTFECFGEKVDEKRLHWYAVNGYFVLQDYAVATWFHHVRALVDAGKDLFAGDPENQPSTTDIENAMDDFVDVYQDTILDDTLLPNAQEDCDLLRNQRFYENLIRIWNHILIHQKIGWDARNEVSIESLARSLSRNRKLIEDLSTSAVDLSQFYGRMPFKCPKLTCFYFHEGFRDAKTRDKHIDRHNRPFICTFTDCSVADFGFASNNDLEKHKRFYHPEAIDQATSFTAPPKKILEKARFQCSLCSKKFTRKLNLRSHMRNHAGERPFPCSECGKAFARSNDLTRHEKIHARR